MLDQISSEPFDHLIASAPCRLTLGAELSAYLNGSQRAAASPIDERLTGRIAAYMRAAVDVWQELPAFPRRELLAQAIITDVSLRGMRFLFDQQLFPGERVAVWLPQVELTGEVARCRRLAKNGYEIGVRLQAPLPAGQLKQFLVQRRQAGL